MKPRKPFLLDLTPPPVAQRPNRTRVKEGARYTAAPTLHEQYLAIPQTGRGKRVVDHASVPLTPRQEFLLGVIVGLVKELGTPPSRREVWRKIGISRNALEIGLKHLAAKGVIRMKPGDPRIAVVGLVPPALPARRAYARALGSAWRWIGLAAAADRGTPADTDVWDGTWFRIGPPPVTTADPSTWVRPILIDPSAAADPRPPIDNVAALEMVTGPAGADRYVRIDRDNPQFVAIVEVLLAAAA